MQSETDPLPGRAGATTLVVLTLLLAGCANSFWDRSPCVGGVTQTPPTYAPAPQCAPPTYAPRVSAPPTYAPPTYAPPAYAEAAPAPYVAEAPPPTATYAEPSTPNGVVSPSAEEQAVLQAVNRIRAQRGLRPFAFHPALYLAARAHSEEQLRHGYMGHGSPDPARRTLAQRITQAGYAGTVYAEVVAWGYEDVDGVVNGWMNSPDHRDILVDAELTQAAFSRVGSYWTGNFGVPRASAPAYAPRAAPAPAPTYSPAPRYVPAPATAPAPAPAHRPSPASPPTASPPVSDLFQQPAVRPAPAPAAPPAAAGG